MAAVLPAPSIVIPRLRLPRWMLPWERTKDDVAVAFSALNNAGDNNANANSTLAVPATTAGSLLVFAISYDPSGGSMSGITGGGTWARIGTAQFDSGNSQNAELWYCPNATAGVTSINPGAGLTTATNGQARVYCEFSGVATSTPLDTQDTTKAFFASSTTTDAETSNNITPAASGELIISAIYDQTGTAPTFTPGTGWTLGRAQPGVAASTGAVALEWKVGVSGAQHSTWTINKTGDSVTVQVAAFKAAAGVAASLVTDTRRVQRNSLLRRHHDPARDRVSVYMKATRPGWRPSRSGLVVPVYA